MNKLVFPAALLSSALLLTAQQCASGGGGSGKNAPLDTGRLPGTWLHAFEEDHGDTLVFRPNTFAFKPARGRTGFQVEAGGALTQFDIAPTDGLEAHQGRWRLEQNVLYATFPDKSSPDYHLRMVSLGTDKLEAVRTFEQQ